MGVKLSYKPDTDEIDITVVDTAFEDGDELETDVIISLFSDARATQEDLEEAGYPEGTDPRGWWMDTYPEVQGDAWGSKLWLLARALWDNDALANGKKWTEEALAHLVADGAARKVEVETSWLDSSSVMKIAIAIYQPGGNVRRFSYLWDAIKGVAESE